MTGIARGPFGMPHWLIQALKATALMIAFIAVLVAIGVGFLLTEDTSGGYGPSSEPVPSATGTTEAVPKAVEPTQQGGP